MISKSMLTPPFPGHVKPVRSGIYKTSIEGLLGTSFSFWSGYQWFFYKSDSVDFSWAAFHNTPGFQWQGLKDPNVKLVPGYSL